MQSAQRFHRHLLFFVPLALVSLLILSFLPQKQLFGTSHTIESLTPPQVHASHPQIPKQKTYTLFFVGDSMTDALGLHASVFSKILGSNYPGHHFIVDNYSEGARNITSLPEMLDRSWRGLDPAIGRQFDIIIIESFGQNPMSSLPLADGLKQQENTMDNVLSNIRNTHPNSMIILYASVAPSEKDYAKGILDLTPDKRVEFSRERRAYMENFIHYAQSHGLPLVDVYHQSLNGNGTLKTQFVNQHDFIHPSQYAVTLIQQRLANFVISHHYLPE